ncbi:MAG: Alkaline serine protease, subtilase family protein [uncultured Sulfurovum sp.]|uniref:Alkaline serine protease, subtilase family protein n=1 Tax=uncultured Sulfurovum sp. TaxID=269237 RepID=A0A6S6U302_9BACT|nr:MAG: Alkaline serine protease, subtilase family protein [uncultured Sulfurovum sp.]
MAQKEPYYNYAWHIESTDNTLNSKGYTIDKDADINVTEAWKISMGSGVKVAVIDDGADVDHEDLKSNLFVAYNADDDSSNINANSEEASHGNSCAGFIVAPINEKGSVGIAPESKLIAIRQNDDSDANTIKAFEYAKDQGAKVISCSWGTNNVSDLVVAELKSLYDANITVLFASGNDGKSLDVAGTNDESEVEWIIGVGASTEANDVGSYSNYGQNIEVIAPGGDTEQSSGLLGIDDTGEHGGTNQLNLVTNNYSFIDGTSFATPITAGVVALMYATYPNITPAQVKDILINTTTKVGTDVDASYDANGFDSKRAYGKINAGLAVSEAKKLADN